MLKTDQTASELDLKIQSMLEKIKYDCQKFVQTIILAFVEGRQASSTNNNIMQIHNLETGQVRYNKAKEKKQNKVDQYLTQLHKDFLNEFIYYIYQNFKNSSGNKEILQIVLKHYNDYKNYSYQLFKMFYNLDSYCLPLVGTTLANQSLKLFKEGYFDKFYKVILNTILSFIHEARLRNDSLNNQVKQLIEMYFFMDFSDVELKYDKIESKYIYESSSQKNSFGSYQDTFNKSFEEETKQFYLQEIDKKQNLSTSEFISWANSIFKFEFDLCKEFFPNSQLTIEENLTKILIKDQAARLINSTTGLGYMLQNDKTDELKQLFEFIFKTQVNENDIALIYQNYFQQQVQEKELQKMQQVDGQMELMIDIQLISYMKSSKTVTQFQLVKYGQSMISILNLDEVIIQRRIDNLIERQYIIRDENEKNIYHYLN